jgi:hypothetical protein
MGLFSKDEPVPVVMESGKQLTCLVCGGSRFYKRDILMNTPGLTFLNLDWANATATCRICGDCGNILWFAKG